MDSRYIFRGKRTDNGELVYGNLIQRKIWSSELYVIRVEDNGFDAYEEYEVIPKTVVRCTELKDKNGKLVFEGDIIRAKKYGRVITHSTVSDYDISELLMCLLCLGWRIYAGHLILLEIVLIMK